MAERILWTSLTVLLGGVALTLGSVLVIRLTTGARRLRRERIAARLRPLVLELLASESEAESSTVLDQVSVRHWRVLETSLFQVLAKVRGESRSPLVEAMLRRGVLDRAAEGLGSRSAVRRARAADTLGGLGAPAGVPLLISLLDDRATWVRRVAIRSLGAIGDASAVQPLLDCLRDDHSLGADVAAALGTLDREGGRASMLTALGSSDALVRATAAHASGLSREVAAVPRLIDLVRSDAAAAVRVRAAGALAALGAPTSAGALTAALTDPDPLVRAAAATGLGGLGDEAAVPSLAVLLLGPHEVARTAAQALVRLGPHGRAALAASSSPHALEALNHEALPDLDRVVA